jgi:hypothetical protein
MIEIGRQAIALQAIPIGNPDAVPKRQFQKKKIHGKANARGLSGAEIAAKELKARKARQAREDSNDNKDDEDGMIVLDTPPRATGVSQGGTSIALAIRSPEAPQRPIPLFRLFSEEFSGPPASTAPPRLQADEGRGKRKRTHTNAYKQSVEDGELDESQHGKAGRARGDATP